MHGTALYEVWLQRTHPSLGTKNRDHSQTDSSLGHTSMCLVHETGSEVSVPGTSGHPRDEDGVRME